MSDLISRSELLKRFLVNKDGHIIPERDCDNFTVAISIKDVKKIIKEMPIAYSVEGVAHELSKLKHTDISNCDNYIDKIYGYCKQCDRTKLVDKAIEIVKDGGMSAMCELEEEFEEVE